MIICVNDVYLVYLAGIHGTKTVCGEVAHDACTPMHILQAAFCIVLGGTAQVLLHLGIPQLGDVIYAYLALKELLLYLISACTHAVDVSVGSYLCVRMLLDVSVGSCLHVQMLWMYLLAYICMYTCCRYISWPV